MKKFKYLLIMFLALTVSVSCSDDDDDINTDLVGTWEMSESEDGYEYSVLITFKDNGTGTIVAVETFDGEIDSDSEAFTWGTDGNKLTIVIDGGEETATYVILGNKLTITDGNGVSIFTKV
ncbi:lipocalin family protein [Lutimonas halocynthiae]|uniref:lipocalin family protein n=1 Tax=Lutimonas halocynthiae TaxID=1446477 RepID=UPI0025B52152|nr:lipocalin family protein [Lutimonas halocynthiae]MDN3643007.1 lipocalin family protein [Lutimonas halocynthiae]